MDMDVEARRSRRQQVADVLAVGALIAPWLCVAALVLLLAVGGGGHYACGSLRDLVVGFLTGALPVPALGGIALGVAALILRTRLKGLAIAGLLSAVLMVPTSAMFAFTACY